jgi:hypothetical protein
MWLSESAPEITWSRLEVLMRETVAEARRRIQGAMRNVEALRQALADMHAGVRGPGQPPASTEDLDT